MIELGNRRVLAPGRWLWARALGWMVALFFAVGLVSGIGANLLLRLFALLDGTPAADPSKEPMWLQFPALALGLLLGVGVYIAATRWGEDRPRPAELAPRRLLPEWLLGLAVGFVLMAVTIGVMALAGS